MNKSRILIVDDDRFIRVFVRRILPQDSYEVLEAKNGAEALQILAKETVDVVLLDLLMPKMHGIEALQRIRKRFSANELPVVILSGIKTGARIAEAIRLGANDYLVKPVSSNLLEISIEVQLFLMGKTR